MTDPTDAAKLPPHKTIPIQVTVDVDEQIAETVKYLQTVPGVRTHTSCAGGKTYAPYVMATYTKEAREYLLNGGFTFTSEGKDWGYIHPPSLTKPDEPENTRPQPAPPEGEPDYEERRAMFIDFCALHKFGLNGWPQACLDQFNTIMRQMYHLGHAARQQQKS